MFYDINALFINESRGTMSRLNGEQVKIGYGDTTIINNLDVEIPDGKVTSIIGPNGCGSQHCSKRAISFIIH